MNAPNYQGWHLQLVEIVLNCSHNGCGRMVIPNWNVSGKRQDRSPGVEIGKRRAISRHHHGFPPFRPMNPSRQEPFNEQIHPLDHRFAGSRRPKLLEQRMQLRPRRYPKSPGIHDDKPLDPLRVPGRKSKTYRTSPVLHYQCCFGQIQIQRQLTEVLDMVLESERLHRFIGPSESDMIDCDRAMPSCNRRYEFPVKVAPGRIAMKHYYRLTPALVDICHLAIRSFEV